MRLRLRIGEERDAVVTKLVEQGIESKKGRYPEYLRMALTMKELEENRELITETLSIAEGQSH